MSDQRSTIALGDINTIIVVNHQSVVHTKPPPILYLIE